MKIDRKSKSRILIFSAQYQGRYGATASMINLVKTLSTSHECIIVTTAFGNLTETIEKEGLNYRVIQLGNHANVLGRQARNYNSFKKNLMALQLVKFQIHFMLYAIKNKFDFIYSNNQGSFFKIFPVIKILKAQSVTYIRSVAENDFITRLCIKHCDQIITIADGLLDNLPKIFLEPFLSKIKTIHTGFDFKSFEDGEEISEVNSNLIRIGYVASISQRKGLDFLVSLFIESEKLSQNACLVICGQPIKDSEEYFKKCCNRLDSAGVTYIYLGYRKDIHNVYKSLDLMALPSLAEGLPRAVIEAMAHGIPVLANNVGGVKQIIKNEENGFILEPGDSSSWTKAVNLMISDSKKRLEMGKKAKEFVTENFSKEKFEIELRKVFG